MANTYTQCYIHIVFSPKNRNRLIHDDWKDELEKYITSIIQFRKHKLLAINAMPDHIHILIGYNINDLIPQLVEDIKTSSNQWINSNKVSNFKFEWQKGYGAFSNSKHELSIIINYILNQKEHHKKKKFRDEYMQFLNENEIEFKNEYLFDFFD